MKINGKKCGNVYFTSDQHFGHSAIIRHCNRPFKNAFEMDEAIIERHNSVVGDKDTVFNLGDLRFRGKGSLDSLLSRLNGTQIFIKGSHDGWMKGPMMWEGTIENQQVVMCHYAMRSWRWSFHGSWQLHGHSHGRLKPMGKQVDVGVDSWDFTPVSWSQVCEAMAGLEKGDD